MQKLHPLLYELKFFKSKKKNDLRNKKSYKFTPFSKLLWHAKKKKKPDIRYLVYS